MSHRHLNTIDRIGIFLAFILMVHSSDAHMGADVYYVIFAVGSLFFVLDLLTISKISERTLTTDN